MSDFQFRGLSRLTGITAFCLVLYLDHVSSKSFLAEGCRRKVPAPWTRRPIPMTRMDDDRLRRLVSTIHWTTPYCNCRFAHQICQRFSCHILLSDVYRLYRNRTATVRHRVVNTRNGHADHSSRRPVHPAVSAFPRVKSPGFRDPNINLVVKSRKLFSSRTILPFKAEARILISGVSGG